MVAGAAPGGWTEFLARSKGLRVYAVDPAELHPDVLALPGVTHLRKTSQVPCPALSPVTKLAALLRKCRPRLGARMRPCLA